jgi:hypothetical protein
MRYADLRQHRGAEEQAGIKTLKMGDEQEQKSWIKHFLARGSFLPTYRVNESV